MKFFSVLFVFILAFSWSYAMAEEPTNQNFLADQKVQQIAEAYSLDAIDLAKNQFGITLDWSDASVGNVEQMLAQMHTSYITVTPRPTEAQVMSFAKAFGSYVGEVYRRNHGGEWGMVTLNGQKFPGMRTKSGTNFWPWGRASNRITNGSEDNMLDYYRVLLQK